MKILNKNPFSVNNNFFFRRFYNYFFALCVRMKVSLILAVGFMFVCSCAAFTELNHYVAYNDNVYHWNVSETVITKPTYTVYNIYLTSQVCFLKFYNYLY